MKRLIAISVLIASMLSANSQPWKNARVELFGGIAAFQYFGDIGGTSGDFNYLGFGDIDIVSTRPGLSLGARYQLSKQIQLKGAFSSGLLTKSDINSRNEGRNFAFSTYVNEVAVMGEFYLIPESDENYIYNIMQIRGGLKHFKQPVSLYLTLGLGGNYFKVTPNDVMVLQNRFSQSSRFSFFIPMGIGVKYAVMPKVSLGAELLGRITSTNELDGYDSPFAKYNDFYHSLVIKVNYKIQRSRKAASPPSRRKRFIF